MGNKYEKIHIIISFFVYFFYDYPIIIYCLRDCSHEKYTEFWRRQTKHAEIKITFCLFGEAELTERQFDYVITFASILLYSDYF